MTEPIDPYKTLQVDPEAEDEVIQAAYRRLARKYHPDVAAGEAAARMAAINAAWALIGEPEARARTTVDGRSAATPPEGRPAGHRRRRRRSAEPSPAAGRRAGEAGGPEPSPGQPRPPENVSRDWTTGRSSVGGGYDPSMRDAGRARRRRDTARQPVGERPQLRPVRRLVARARSPGGPRVHRVARPRADRPPVPRRDRRHPATGRAAAVRRRRGDATAEGCSAGADGQRSARLRRTVQRRRVSSRPRAGDRRALDDQREEHDAET